MLLRCPHCSHTLEFTLHRPRFCSECGKALNNFVLEQTVPYSTALHDPEATRPYPVEPGHPATAPPELVGGYRLLRPIGSGGMGTVYEAEDTGTRRRVALKLIRPDFATSQDAVERFRREGRLAGTIVHPRCVFVLAADEEAGRPYIVMELMPGETLADLVQRHGPLPAWEAVTLILDVIEGLQEAHRCGLIHRDVKPSNCFLDADGRVKVGDFGLAKSLVQRGALTHTGSFLGTVHYAAPEQIKNDKVDRQADVYSAAATLYFLLTGKAPFEADDPAQALARTLSDPLTPMRQLRPNLPNTLDEVVRRGLARPRERRWQGLEEFRLALLPFVPGAHTVGEVGWRFAAYLIDSAILIALEFVLLALLVRAMGGTPAEPTDAGFAAVEAALSLAVFVLWFAAPEEVWGCSLGKYLCRLRVRGERTDDRPTWAASLSRTLFFWLIKDGPFRLLNGLVLWHLETASADQPSAWRDLFNLFLLLLPQLLRLAGVGLIVATMRRANGFRGLHEFLSGTKVIYLPGKETDRALPAPAQPAARPKADGKLPQRLGAFTILAALRHGPSEHVLLGVDEILDRQVWIWVRPADGSSFRARRREINRTTRPRWLAGGQDGDREWDAFVASPGWLLTDLAKSRGRLSWPQARPVLEQLAEELSRSCDEGSLPPSLQVGQTWVQNTGRVQLLDTPLAGAANAAPVADEQYGCLNLLRQAAVLTLEGKLPAPGAPRPVQAPVPTYASEFLARLVGGTRPFRTVQEAQAAMQAVRDRPPAVSRGRRGFALALEGALLAVGAGFMLSLWMLLLLVPFIFNYQFLGALGQVALEDLRRDEQLPAAPADPVPAAKVEKDLRTEARLRDDLQYIRTRRAATLASSSWFVRRAVDRLDVNLHDFMRFQVDSIKGPQKISADLPEITPDARQNARIVHRALADQRRAAAETAARDVTQDVALMLVWPILWVFWAGLTRGGLSLALAGVAVVQQDGRRASRWRCVARALLVWAPFAGLLLTALLLDLWQVASSQGPTLELRAAAWLAWLLWWLALAWLPLHLLLNLRWPDRGWHDRLAGTYLVPR